MKKSTEVRLRWIFLFLSFDQPNAGNNRNARDQDNLPGKSACYEYRCRAIGTANNTDTVSFFHPAHIFDQVGSQLTMTPISDRFFTSSISFPNTLTITSL